MTTRSSSHVSLSRLTPRPTDRDVGERSVLIKNLLEDVGDSDLSEENAIPIQNVSLSGNRPV